MAWLLVGLSWDFSSTTGLSMKIRKYLFPAAFGLLVATPFFLVGDGWLHSLIIGTIAAFFAFALQLSVQWVLALPNYILRRFCDKDCPPWKVYVVRITTWAVALTVAIFGFWCLLHLFLPNFQNAPA